MPRKSSKKKATKDEVTVVEKEGEEVLPPTVKVEEAVTEPPRVKVEEEDDVAWVRKQLSAASKQKGNVDDIRDAINDPDSEFKFMPPDTNRSTASLAMVTDEQAAAAAPAKRGRKQKADAGVAVAAPPVVVVAEKPAAAVAAKPVAQPSGKPAWLLAQEKAQASRTETVTAKPTVQAAWTDESKGSTGSKKVVVEATTLRIKTEAKPAVPAIKPEAAQEVKDASYGIEITPARVDMAVGKEHTSRVLPNQQVVTRIFSGIYNAEPSDSDVNGMF